MATTYSRNLKLRLDSNLTANAIYNLTRLDTLGSTFIVDTNSLLAVRSISNILLEPEASDIGGSGAGGSVSIGTPSHVISALEIYTSLLNLNSSLGLLDQATGGTKFLRLGYKSDISGSVDTISDRQLLVDLDGTDRALVLGGDLSVLGGSLVLNLAGTTSISLPQSGTLSTLNGIEVLTQKTIDAASNTITGLTNSSISASAGIIYSKLDLTSSLLNSDISNSAAISYGKLSLTGQLLDSDISSSAAIARDKIAAAIPNQIVVNDGSGNLSGVAELPTSLGGTGIASGATFPVSGVVVTETATETLTNKSLSGFSNTFTNIPYSALYLTNLLVDADIKATAAIAYSKLNLSASITNSDISTSAAIAYSKLDLIGSIANADILSGAAISYSKLNLSSSITNSDVSATAAIAGTKISPNFGNQYPLTTAGYRFSEGGHLTTLVAAQSLQTTDLQFELPADYGTNGQALLTNGSGTLRWGAGGGGSGSVTSVGLAAPAEFVVSNSPVTSTGTLTLAWATEVANTVLAGPTSGADATPAFRALGFSDLPTLTASRALQTNGSGLISVSSITSTELGYLSGTTSSIQTQLGTLVPLSQKGAINGVATLDGSGKVPLAQLPNSIMEFQGAWDPSTNTPTISDGTGTPGHVYRVSTNYASTVSGLSDPSMVGFLAGDFIIYASAVSMWQRAPIADGVVSVNGSQGIVTVNAISQLTGDITAGPASGSQSRVATIAAGAVTTSKLGTVTDGVTLDQLGSGSTLEIKTGGISNTQIASSAAITLTKLAALSNHNRALVSDSSGFVSESAVTSTELGYVSGVTSALQTQLSGKQATGNYITALTGDVTAAGPGSAAATVVTVGTSSATNIHNAELAANAATSSNTASTIVKRDGSGNFAAGNLTLGPASGSSAISIAFSNAFTGTLQWNPTASYTVSLPPTSGAASTYLVNDGSGNLTWSNPLVNIDGGSPASNYTSSQVITGGTP